MSILSLSHKRIGASLALFAFAYRMLSYMLTFVRLRLLSSLPSLAPSSLPTASHRTRLLSRLVRLLRGEGVVPFIATLLASPALLLLPAQTATSPGAATFPRKTFALHLFTKGLQTQFNSLRQRRSRAVSWVPDWCDSALLYAVGNGQLLWAFLFEPDCFPQGCECGQRLTCRYCVVLTLSTASDGNLILARSSAYITPRPSDLPAWIEWPSKREVADHVAILSTPTAKSSAFPNFISPSLSALHPSPYPTTSYPRINPVLDFSPAHPAHSRLLCALLHPTEPSCKRNFLRFWATEWKASARFISVFLAAVNVLKWKSWKKDPEGSLFRLAMGVVQGATVISGSIGSAWALTCAFQHYFVSRTLSGPLCVTTNRLTCPYPLVSHAAFFLASATFSTVSSPPSSSLLYQPLDARSWASTSVACPWTAPGRYCQSTTGSSRCGEYLALSPHHARLFPLADAVYTPAHRNGDVLLLALGFAMLTSMREEGPSALGGYLRNLLYLITGPRLSSTSSATAGLPVNSAANEAGWSSSPDVGFDLTHSSSIKGRPKSKTG